MFRESLTAFDRAPTGAKRARLNPLFSPSDENPESLVRVHDGILTSFVAIEGPKGSGNSTVLACLETLLLTLNVQYRLCKPTARHDTNPLETAVDRGIVEPDRWRQARYALRAIAAYEGLEHRKELIIGDRSPYTSLVTWMDFPWSPSRRRGRSGSQKPLRRAPSEILALQHHTFMPSLVLYLDVPTDILERRCRQRTRTYGQIDETNSRLEHARRAYQAFAQSPEELGVPATCWVTIDGTQAPAKVAADCLRAMLEFRQIRPDHFTHALAVTEDPLDQLTPLQRTNRERLIHECEQFANHTLTLSRPCELTLDEAIPF
jgi:thymidylate kinase